MVEFGLGHLLAIIGAAIAVIIPGIGSALAVSKGGQTAAGLMAEQKNEFIRPFMLSVLPATQGMYGFVIGILIVLKTGVMGELAAMGTYEGSILLAASLPIAIVGFFSALLQSNVARAGITLLGKDSKSFVKGLSMAGVIELYALFAFVISIFLVL